MNSEKHYYSDAASALDCPKEYAGDAIIRFADVQFSHPGQDRMLFEALSIEIAAGEFIAVIGGNGSGKSTFLKHINGLVIPDVGSVKVCSMDTRDAKARSEIRKKVAMVAQNPGSQLLAPIVEDDVAFGPLNAGHDTDDATARVREVLESVGMLELAHAQTASLSGGQAQLVALAGAFAISPHVLLLDEPAAMLDPEGHERVMKAIEEAHRAGMTIVMATHDSDDAVGADRVLLLNAGKIETVGRPEEILLDETLLRACGLELPFACELSGCLAEHGIGVKRFLRSNELKEELCALFSKM